MNKKGEPRISNIVFTIVIAVTLMVLCSSFIVKLASSNNAINTPEFQNYSIMFDEYEEIYNSTITNATNIDRAKSAIDQNASLWTRITDKAEVAWSESIVGKAYNGIMASLGMTGIATKSANNALKTIPGMPKYVLVLVLTLITLLIAFALIRALWEKRI